MKTLLAIILIIILLEATILLGMVVYDELEVRRIIKHKTDRKTEPQTSGVVWTDTEIPTYKTTSASTEPQTKCNWCKFYDGENCYCSYDCDECKGGPIKTEPQTDCSWK